MSSKRFQARRFDSQGVADTEEWVAEEGPLQIRVNGQPFTVTLRTPGADRELAMGLLFSERLVDQPSDLVLLRQDLDARGATVWSAVLRQSPDPAVLSNRSLASTAACGYCGKTEWESPDLGALRPASPFPVFPHGSLERCFEQMRERQGLFGRTGGSHAAAIFSLPGKLLAFGEDVGRHNAVDKAVGELWSRGELSQGLLLCVSGRVSYEIASKAQRAGLRIIAAVSAPSSLAVEYCREAGITLIGFCRAGRATVYSHAGLLGDELAPDQGEEFQNLQPPIKSAN